MTYIIDNQMHKRKINELLYFNTRTNLGFRCLNKKTSYFESF